MLMDIFEYLLKSLFQENYVKKYLVYGYHENGFQATPLQMIPIFAIKSRTK